MRRIVAFIIALYLLPLSASAEPKEGEQLLRPPLLFALSKVELKDSQKSDIARILKTNRERGFALMETLQEKRFALSETVRGEDASEEQVREAARALAQSEEALAVAVFKVGQEIKALLTDEQREELAAVRVTPETHRSLSTADALGARVDEWIEKYSPEK